MKFKITVTPSGDLVTKAGVRVQLEPAGHGLDFADASAARAHYGLTEVSLANARETKLNALQNAFERQCEAGASIALSQSEAIVLALDDQSRGLLDEFASHESRRLGFAADEPAKAAILAEQTALMDAGGVQHGMTIATALQAIIALGEIYKAWWFELATRKGETAAAQTVETVNAIAWRG